MASDNIWYWVDLSGLEDDEFNRVYRLLDDWSFTGLKEDEGYRKYTFIWNDPSNVEELTGLPASVLHRLAGK